MVTKINKDDVDEIATFCRANSILHFTVGLARVGSADKNWTRIADDKLEELNVVANSYPRWVTSATLDDRCGLLAHGVTIDVTGDVVGCPSMRAMRIGNVRNRPLTELMEVYRQTVHTSRYHYCLAREASARAKSASDPVRCVFSGGSSRPQR